MITIKHLLDCDAPSTTLVVTSGSAVTPEAFHSPSPNPRVFSIAPIHLASPKLSATSRSAPILRRRADSMRDSAWCFSVNERTSPVERRQRRARVSLRPDLSARDTDGI
jgi:hypothetical protein